MHREVLLFFMKYCTVYCTASVSLGDRNIKNYGQYLLCLIYLFLKV